MPLWEEPAWIKIHEGCGGRIRWVEAIDMPGVGYTGHCEGCSKGRVVVEEMIPIEVRGEEPGFNGEFDVREQVLDFVLYDHRGNLADLSWDESQDFEENQRRIRGVLLGEEVRGGDD